MYQVSMHGIILYMIVSTGDYKITNMLNVFLIENIQLCL